MIVVSLGIIIFDYFFKQVFALITTLPLSEKYVELIEYFRKVSSLKSNLRDAELMKSGSVQAAL